LNRNGDKIKNALKLSIIWYYEFDSGCVRGARYQRNCVTLSLSFIRRKTWI